ncbi:MAG: acyl carrier protein [Clostridiaceae bacterium]
MIFEKVAKVIAEYKEIDVSEIKLESTFEELNLDSLDTVELVMKLEDELGVSIEMDENLKTVEDVVKEIEKAQ